MTEFVKLSECLWKFQDQIELTIPLPHHFGNVYSFLFTCLFVTCFVQGKDSSGGDYLLVPIKGEGAVERLKEVCFQLRSCLGQWQYHV